VGIEFGCNSKIFDTINDAGITVRAFRAYRDGFNQIPAAWPAKESVPDARVTLSIRPLPDDLLAGRLDERLKSLIAVAPPGVRLSAWHEASNLPGYPDWVTADRMAPVHEYMQELCRGTNVSYGSIICAVPNTVRAWMGRGLDWYGLDVYDFTEGQFRSAVTGRISRKHLFARMDDMLNTARERSGRDNPVIDICETNSPRRAHRGEWFELLFEWLADHNGRCLHTFWNPSGSLSGPWLPDDRATIEKLRSLTAAYA
jgi:hypothetical protein